MSLSFASGSTNRVNHGSGASIDDLPAGANGCSFLAWLYRTADDSNQHILTMDGPIAGTRLGIIVLASSGTAGNLRVVVATTGTAADYIGTGDLTPLNTWTFIASTFNINASPQAHIYTGSRTALATEVGYDSTTDGTGTVVSDASVDKWIGNLDRAVGNLPFVGRIARVGYINTALTLAEIQRLQFAPAAAWAGPNTKLLVEYHGTGTQVDYTGNGNAGTVTGASIADHVPLGPAWGRRLIHAVEFADVATGYGMLIAGGAVIPRIFSRIRQ